MALEQTEEYVDGQLKTKYGDTFIRGNNILYIRSAKLQLSRAIARLCLSGLAASGCCCAVLCWRVWICCVRLLSAVRCCAAAAPRRPSCLLARCSTQKRKAKPAGGAGAAASSSGSAKMDEGED